MPIPPDAEWGNALGDDNLGKNTRRALQDAGITPAHADAMTRPERVKIIGMGTARLARLAATLERMRAKADQAAGRSPADAAAPAAHTDGCPVTAPSVFANQPRLTCVLPAEPAHEWHRTASGAKWSPHAQTAMAPPTLRTYWPPAPAPAAEGAGSGPAGAVAVIRAAAAAMAETAAAVGTVGHDWAIEPPIGDFQWTIHDERGTHVAETPDYGGLELPDYIASWTPPIAQLVAVLLAAIATDIDQVMTDHDGAWFGHVPTEWTTAHNLATAYLARHPDQTNVRSH